MDANLMRVMHNWSQFEQGQGRLEREVEEAQDDEEGKDGMRNHVKSDEEDNDSDLLMKRNKYNLRKRSGERRIHKATRREDVEVDEAEQEEELRETRNRATKKGFEEIARDFEMKKKKASEKNDEGSNDARAEPKERLRSYKDDFKSLDEVLREHQAKKEKMHSLSLGNLPEDRDHAEYVFVQSPYSDRPAFKSSASNYEYTTLSRLKEVDVSDKVNVFGVVVGYSVKRNKKGYSHAYAITFNIVDDSQPSDRLFAVAFNYFVNDEQALDDATRRLVAGDVLRIHRCKYVPWNNEPQLVGNDRYCAVLVASRRRVGFTGLPTTDASLQASSQGEESHCDDERRLTSLSPYLWELQALPTARYSLTERDRLRVIALDKWAEDQFSQRTLSKNAERSQSLASALRRQREGQREPFDFTALVLDSDVSRVARGGALLVWDGSIDGQFTLESHCGRVNILATKTSLHTATLFASMSSDDVSASLRQAAFRRSVTQTTPSTAEDVDSIVLEGLAKMVVVDLREDDVSAAHFIKIGCWHKFKQVYPSLPSEEDVIGRATQQTSITPLLPFYKDVQEAVKAYLSAPSQINEPIAPYDCERLATILCAPPGVYKCCARIIGWFPSDASTLISQQSASVDSSALNEDQQLDFLMSLRVQDNFNTACTDVIFNGLDADLLLGRSPQRLNDQEGGLDEFVKELTNKLKQAVELKHYFIFGIKSYQKKHQRQRFNGVNDRHEAPFSKSVDGDYRVVTCCKGFGVKLNEPFWVSQIGADADF